MNLPLWQYILIFFCLVLNKLQLAWAILSIKKMIYDNFIWKRKHKLIIDMSNFDRYDWFWWVGTGVDNRYVSHIYYQHPCKKTLKSSNSVISITTKSSMFLVYYQYYHFFHWNLNISFFITLKILMNSDSDLWPFFHLFQIFFRRYDMY